MGGVNGGMKSKAGRFRVADEIEVGALIYAQRGAVRAIKNRLTSLEYIQ